MKLKEIDLNLLDDKKMSKLSNRTIQIFLETLINQLNLNDFSQKDIEFYEQLKQYIIFDMNNKSKLKEKRTRLNLLIDFIRNNDVNEKLKEDYCTIEFIFSNNLINNIQNEEKMIL